MAKEFIMYVFGVKLTPAWWKLKNTEKRSKIDILTKEIESMYRLNGTIIKTYASLRYNIDFILWMTSDNEEKILKLKVFLEKLFNDCISIEYGFLSVCEKSSSKATGNDFLVVYPMKKSNDWYLLPKEERNKIMSEHIAIARLSTSNKGIISYTTKSFGISDDEFLVIYEIPSIQQWTHVVEELRHSKSRKWIANEKPVLVGIKDNLFLYSE